MPFICKISEILRYSLSTEVLSVSDSPTPLFGSPWDALEAVGEDVGNAAEWVADTVNEASTALGAAVKSATRSMCASASNGAEWLLELSPGGLQSTFDVCTPWWVSNGSGGPTLEPSPPPFTDGQCPGVTYGYTRTVRTDTRFCSDPSIPQINTGTGEGSGTYVGPVLGIRTVLSGSGDCGPTVAQILVKDTFNGAPRERVAETFTLPSFLRYESVSLSGVAFNRLSGTGSCGDPPAPPPVLTPNPNPLPDPDYGPGEEPYADPTGRPIIPLPPIEDPFGRPINLPPIRLPDFGNPFPFGNPVGPGGPGVPGNPVTTPPGGDAEGSEPGKTLVGVKVELISIPSYAKISETPSENFYIGSCYVYLGLSGRLDLQEEGRFMKQSQFFFAPLPSDSWRVIASSGYVVRVTPYYIEETETV